MREKMKFNKLFGIVLLISVLCLCISAAAAADGVDSHAVGADEGNLAVENNNDDVLGVGNSWYVKAGASGGDGSETSPYGDLKSVTNNANYKENDVIYVMDGTYKGAKNRNIDLKENTTVKAYDGANPIFDAQKQESIFVLSKNGITLQGLTLINGGGVVATTAQGTNSWCGGAICNSGDNLTVDGCTIKSNDPISYGGGIYSKGKNTEIKNSNFEGCEASNGGAIAIDGPYAKIVGNSFKNNAGAQGGAINIYNYGGALIANNSFTRNRANSGYGGAIYARAGENYIVNSTFDHNQAKTYGGAICTVNPNTKIDNCTFKSNQIFNDNSNTNWGGAIYSQGRNTSIVNSRFTDNAVRDDGGAICIRNSKNLVENCTFDKNWAARGGAIFIVEKVSGGNISDVVINNCTFNDNGIITEQDGQPNLGTKGGAIYSWGIDTNVTNSKFNNNQAMVGGAILFERGHNFLENDTFTGNKAVRYGGGAISSTRFGDTINNCTFENNFAQGYGGAVSADYPTITNSKFIGNEANHGGAICTITANVSDSEFYDNKADDNWVVLATTKLIESNNIHPGQVALSMNHTTYLNMEYDMDKEIAIMPGYYAYCMEEFADYPQYGVLWENLRFAQNSLSEERIGEYVKILIFKYWNDESQHENLQKLVNAFTDRDFRNNDNPIVQEIVALYDSGYRVPTDNALRLYDNGTMAIFHFKEIITPSGTQNVFAFNITYNPNLTVEKEVITDPLYVGHEVDFNITVTNTGECNLTDIWINETDFSDGLVYKSFRSPYNWTYDEKSKLWILNDTLEMKKSAYIILTFNVTKAGNMTNNVTTGLGNYTLDNDTVNFTVYAPNMTVEKLTLNKTAFIGDNVTFMIVVTNTGDCNLTNVKVTEVFNSTELRFEDYTNKDKWNRNGNVFTLIGNLTSGNSANFTIVFNALVNGTLINTVNVTSNETENKTANNNTTVYKPNMSVEKISNNKTVKVGEMTSFVIVVKNTGDCNLTGVYVIDQGAEGLEYDHTVDESGKWSYEGDGKWTYNGVLGIKESATFTIVFKALSEGFKVNNAIAGNNITNDTVNSTDTTNVTVEHNETDVPENVTDVPENETAEHNIPEKTVKAKVDAKATGNPLIALIMALVALGFESRRRKQ